MAALRHPSLRNIVTSTPLPLRTQQRRWARVHDVRSLATQPADSRIISKYEAKLTKKAQEEGLPNISALREAYAPKIASLKRPAPKPSKDSIRSSSTPSSSSSSSSSSLPTAPPRPSPPKPTPGIKTLSSYLDVSKIQSLPAKEISAIWRLRHAESPLSLSATIPADVYARLAETAKRHPSFVLPLPRKPLVTDPESKTEKAETEADAKQKQEDERQEEKAAEIHYLEHAFPSPTTSTTIFTSLASYKLHGSFATPHTTLIHHTDLADSHGIVLMNGNVMEGLGVSAAEAQWLVIVLQKFYAGVGGDQEWGKRKKLLEKFSSGDGAFRVEDVLEEAEKVV